MVRVAQNSDEDKWSENLKIIVLGVENVISILYGVARSCQKGENVCTLFFSYCMLRLFYMHTCIEFNRGKCCRVHY